MIPVAAAAVLAAVVAALAAAAGSALVAFAGPVDTPRDRGLHQTPAATSGGLAVVAAVAVGFLLYVALAGADRTGFFYALHRVALALAFAGALGLLGALDDIFDLGPITKLAAQAAAAGAFSVFVAHLEAIPLAGPLSLPLGAPLGMALGAAWLVLVVNAVNFMDGSDGLVGGAVAIAFLALSAAAFSGGAVSTGGIALVAAAALLGFLPRNLRGRRLFLGDAGSLFVGFLIGALALTGSGFQARAPVSPFIVSFALTPILVDVLMTLLWRARRGLPLLQAHRDHLYQLWLTTTGRSHLALAVRVWGLTAAYSALGLLAGSLPGMEPPTFAIGAAAAAAAWLILRPRLEAAAEIRTPG